MKGLQADVQNLKQERSICKFYAIWYHLHNLKNVKNINGGVLLLEACNFTKSNSPLWVFLMFFKLHKWYQIAQSVSNMSLLTKLLQSPSIFLLDVQTSFTEWLILLQNVEETNKTFSLDLLVKQFVRSNFSDYPFSIFFERRFLQ